MKQQSPHIHLSPRKRLRRVAFISALSLLSLMVSGIILCNNLIENQAKDRLYNQTATIPYHKVALLLGASPKLKSGNDNLYYVYRIKAAVELYRAGKVRNIIISGDNKREDYNEPEEMRQALIQHAVPDSVIYLDYAGFRTLDSVVRAKEIFGQDSITIISQQFHNERAIYLAEQYHIHAIGFTAEDVSTYYGLKTTAREYLARVKVFVDIAMNKQPHFLGERVEIK